MQEIYIRESISTLIFIACCVLGIVLLLGYNTSSENDAFTQHQKHEDLDHPCLKSDNGKVAVISSSLCANSHSNTTTEVEYFKSLVYTITGVDSKNFRIYMER